MMLLWAVAISHAESSVINLTLHSRDSSGRSASSNLRLGIRRRRCPCLTSNRGSCLYTHSKGQKENTTALMWPNLLFALIGTLILPCSARTRTTASGLVIQNIRAVPCTRHTQIGDTIQVHYNGSLQSTGVLFDSSYSRDAPFTFTLGKGQVIKGWDEGLQDMCIGEARTLIVPPSLGYGDRGAGSRIPGGATLVFDTELMGIEGVEKEEVEEAQDTQHPIPSPTVTDPPGGEPTAPPFGNPTPPRPSEPPKGAQPGAEDGECRLLGPFSLVIQSALGLLALLSLVYKRFYREYPRRPVKVWLFDISKQVVGSVLLHLANLGMSLLSSGQLDFAAKAAEAVKQSAERVGEADAATKVVSSARTQPNPCSFYLLNIFIDTTIGIPILLLLLKVLHVLFSYSPLANPPESIESGNYGLPPYKASWWAKQSLIYFLGLFGMKLCVFGIFELLPWIVWIGDWALRWTEGKEWLQVRSRNSAATSCL